MIFMVNAMMAKDGVLNSRSKFEEWEGFSGGCTIYRRI